MNRFHSLRSTVRQPGGAIGAVILVLILAVAYLGRFVAPHSPTATVGGAVYPPGNGLVLGTDYLGRDVFSRVLHGGATVITMAVVATLSAYIVGIAIGIVAGYTGGYVDMLLMRAVDIVLAFPPLMVLLLLVGGFSNHLWVLVLGVMIVQIPSISRITRGASQSVSKSEFVDAARARGDSLMTIAVRDVLRNISSTVLADFGIRFGVSIILIASMNYLGLGLNPPASDWGLMISENQNYISLNPYSVLVPALMLALITVGVNLFADAYIRAVNAGSRGVMVLDDDPAVPIGPADVAVNGLPADVAVQR